VAVYAQRGSSFEATCQGFNSGLVGTLGVRVLDNVGGTTIARTTAGITELVAGSGTYAVVMIAPQILGDYTIMWDDGVASPDHTAVEQLTVLDNTTVQVASGTEGMTFGQILDDVMGNPLRFEPELRARAGRAVNHRYAHVWGLEDWTFRFDYAQPVTAGSNPILQNLPVDFGVPVYLWDENGAELSYVVQDEFQARYFPSSSPGTPEAYTVVNQLVYLGPTPSSAVNYLTYYRRRLSPLVDESDYPMLPPEYHLMLVHGGRAELLAASDDPMGQTMEQQWQMDLEALRREYLVDVLGQPSQWETDYWAVG
jgi:hypothetical protein